MKRVHVYVSGRVQGVFFRSEMQRNAIKLNLAGWVRNREDGLVEALLEGEDDDVDEELLLLEEEDEEEELLEEELELLPEARKEITRDEI